MIFVAIYAAIGLVSAVIWHRSFPASERRGGAEIAWAVVAGGLFWPIAAVFIALEVWQEEALFMALMFAVFIVVVLVALAR